MGKGIFEVWVSGGIKIRTEDLRKTLSELSLEGVDIWFREKEFWIRINAYDVGRFLSGEDVDVVYTLQPPWYRGLVAIGKTRININDFE